MLLGKLLKYRLNLNRFEDTNVISYCHGNHDAINISHERSCHSSDMQVVLASRNVRKRSPVIPKVAITKFPREMFGT